MQLDSVAQWWGQLMIAVLWQAALLVVVASVACWWLARSSATVRFWIWQLVAFKLLLIPFWTLVVPLPDWWSAPPAPGTDPPVVAQHVPPRDATKAQPDSQPPQFFEVTPPPIESPDVDRRTDTTVAPPELVEPTAPEGADAPAAASVVDINSKKKHWLSGVLCAWVAVVLIQIGRLVRIQRRLSRLLRAAQPGTGLPQELVEQFAARLKIAAPTVLFSTEVNSPFVCGLWRPRLVFPVALAEQLNEKQMSQVVCHELAHLCRRDLIWNWIHELVRILYFFHPAIYWIHSRLHLERELACDQLAIRCCDSSAQQYALTLVDVLSRVWQPASLSDTAESSDKSAKCSLL